MTTLTLIAGYFFSKSATSWSMSGTHVQNVSSVGFFIAASMSAWLTGFEDAEAVPPPSPPPQADRAAPNETAPTAVSRSRRLTWDWLGVEWDLRMTNSRRWLRNGTPSTGVPKEVMRSGG
ncbi:hypothetical protein ACIF85_32155 [Streptomyces sp. NPDC086033]|uniref:hypothetical protein n=1 Tax=Streptomyces sp. NPDC086033 TaxID=3365747 RepID=UPI0037CD6253